METYNTSMAQQFVQLLASEAAQARLALQGESAMASASEARDVADFKDVAEHDVAAAIRDIQAAHASSEMKQVLAALGRLQDGTYGKCLDCGKPIDLRRLMAIPSTPYCTSCQSAREHQHGAHPRA